MTLKRLARTNGVWEATGMHQGVMLLTDMRSEAALEVRTKVGSDPVFLASAAFTAAAIILVCV